MRKLVPRIEAALQFPAEARVQVILEDRWIGYRAAKRILNDLERLLQHPKIPRMPSRIIVGASGNGKTAVVRRFRHQHPPRINPEEEASSVPVLLTEAPPVPDETRLFQSILDELNFPFSKNESAGVLEMRVKQLLPKVGTRMIIIDEIQHVLAGPDLRQQRFMNHIKRLGNVLMIPLVLVGIPTALTVIATDEQLASRFQPVSLPLWNFDNQFRTLLASLESFLPLQKPSDLAENDELAEEIYRLSGGIIGNVSKVVNDAAIRAIESGEECVTKQLLLALDLNPPEEQLISIAASTKRRTAL